MSKAKFDAARELVREKQYDEARAILRTVDHPQATAWLAKIDEIDPPEVTPIEPTQRPQRTRTQNAILVIIGLVMVVAIAASIYILIWRQIDAPNVRATLTMEAITVKSTSSLPIPAKVSEIQDNELIQKCLSSLSGGMASDFAKSIDDSIEKHEFLKMGITTHVYLNDSGCAQTEIFQIIWHSYSAHNDRLLRQNIDKGVAWTKFLEGWQFSKDSDIQQTATVAAFRTSKPTEVMATSILLPTIAPFAALTKTKDSPIATLPPTWTPEKK